MFLAITFYFFFIPSSILDFLNDKKRWIVMPIALVHALFVIPLAFFTFYKGYQGIMLGQGYFKLYIYCETFIVSIGFIVFLLSLSGYHGPLYLISIMANKKASKPLLVFVIVENILFVMGLGLRAL